MRRFSVQPAARGSEARRVTVIVWLILSLGAAATIAAFVVLPENVILDVSRHGRLPGHGEASCPFCGMTRAFVAISHREAESAMSMNRGAVPLYVGLLLNEVLAIAYLAGRLRALRSIRLRASTGDARVHM